MVSPLLRRAERAEQVHALRLEMMHREVSSLKRMQKIEVSALYSVVWALDVSHTPPSVTLTLTLLRVSFLHVCGCCAGERVGDSAAARGKPRGQIQFSHKLYVPARCLTS